MNKILSKLNEYPVLSKNALMRLGYSREYSYLLLQRMVKQDKLTKIIKGKYSASHDLYQIASNLYFPSYISLLTASYYKKYTEQIINSIQVISKKKMNLEVNGTRIEFIRSSHIFGYHKENGTFLCDDETLLLDMLSFRDKSGNFEEILKVIKQMDIDKVLIIDYLKRRRNSSLVKRAGYLLSSYRDIDISAEFNLDNNYVSLDSLALKNERIVSKWRVKL